MTAKLTRAFGKGHFETEGYFELADHPIGSDSVTEPAVLFFKFNFEEDSSLHRGTSDRHPASPGFPRAVTVKDVMSAWIKLKGEKRIASWCVAGSRAKSTKMIRSRTSECLLS